MPDVSGGAPENGALAGSGYVGMRNLFRALEFQGVAPLIGAVVGLRVISVWVIRCSMGGRVTRVGPQKLLRGGGCE